MFLSKKLINSFFTNWHSETTAANNFNQMLDIPDAIVAELFDLSQEYLYIDYSKQLIDSSYYFDRVSSLVQLMSLIEQLDIDSKNCYFASVKHVTFLFTRNKHAFVDHMQKILYSNGWLPVHKKVIRLPKKKIYSAIYFTNTPTIITPTKN